jgi:hypothetical protein
MTEAGCSTTVARSALCKILIFFGSLPSNQSQLSGPCQMRPVKQGPSNQTTPDRPHLYQISHASADTPSHTHTNGLDSRVGETDGSRDGTRVGAGGRFAHTRTALALLRQSANPLIPTTYPYPTTLRTLPPTSTLQRVRYIVVIARSQAVPLHQTCYATHSVASITSLGLEVGLAWVPGFAG